MRIPSGVTDQVISFVAVDSTDLKTRETGLTTFTVYRMRNGGTVTVMTTPTVTEVDATNMPGVYKLLLDEDMTIGSGNLTEEFIYHITQAAMAPVTRAIELFNPANYIVGTVTTVTGGATAANLATVDTVVDEIKVVTDKFAFTTANQVDSNMLAVSSDAVAADNMELQYDGTGLIGDNFPSKQSQIDSLAATPGVGASPSVPSTITVVAGLTPAGDADDMANDDANVYTLNDNAGTLTLDLDYQLTADTTVIEYILVVAAQGNTDDIAFQIYDQVGATFVTFETITGANVLTYITLDKVTVSKYTNSSGLFQVRLTGTGLGSATLTINKAVAYSVSTVRSVGYALGRVWLDTVNGTAGTVSFVNGTADNKVLSLTDATTIAGNVGLSSFDVAPGSTVTLLATYSNAIAYIYGAILNLNNQDISNTITYGGQISGITTGTGPVHFIGSEIGTSTFPPAHFENCSFTSTFIIGSAGIYNFSKCYSESLIFIIDFAAIGATTVFMSQFSGRVELQNMAAGDVVRIQGNGELIINANCAAGTVKYSGDFELTDNGSATVTTDDNTTNLALALEDTNELQTDWANAGRLDAILDSRMAEASINTTAGAIDNVTLNATTTTNTDMRGTDSANTTAPDNTSIAAILVDTGTTLPAQITALNDPTAAAVAAAVASFDMGNGRTIEEALAFLRNKWTLIGTTITVYDTDDTTIVWTSVVAKAAGDPVSSSDPA